MSFGSFTYGVSSYSGWSIEPSGDVIWIDLAASIGPPKLVSKIRVKKRWRGTLTVGGEEARNITVFDGPADWRKKR